MTRKITNDIKNLRGTARPDRAQAAAGPGGGPPRPPRGLRRGDPAAWAWWRQLVDVLPWLTAADGPALLLLCRHMARADEAAAAMIAAGLATRDGAHGGDMKQSPATLVWAREAAAAARLLKEVGATVAGRAARPVAADDAPPLADLLFAMTGGEQ